MDISLQMRKEMQADMQVCAGHSTIEGSELLTNQMIAKYSLIDPDFEKSICKIGKLTAVGKEADYRKELQAAAARLKALLLMHPIDENVKHTISGNKVFIVHGHDSAAKITVARTLEKLGLQAVILHEQPDQGKTIIEKLETFTAEAVYAIVLYTECDVGRSKERGESANRNRARQNVVFEHGLFIGSLGRDRVCALVKGDIEKPGDLDGVVYITMDEAGAWKMQLCKNMQGNRQTCGRV